MKVKIETLTARYLAGLIYAGRLDHSTVLYRMEELGADDKMERINELLEEMYLADELHALRNNA